MVFSGSLFLCRSCFVFCILLGNHRLNFFHFLLFQPFELFFLFLLLNDILFSRNVNILQQINSGLLFSLPLAFSHFILPFGFLLYEYVQHFFVNKLITFRFLVMFLKLNDFLSSSKLFSFFNWLNCFFFLESCFEKFSLSFFGAANTIRQVLLGPSYYFVQNHTVYDNSTYFYLLVPWQSSVHDESGLPSFAD